MAWLIFAPPALWAAVAHIDKYLLQERGGVGALTLVAAVTGAPAAGVILLVRHDALELQQALAVALVINGMVHVGSLVLYFSALARTDAAVVAAVLQAVAVFSYLLGWAALGERLTPRQLVASALIVGGGAALAVELDRAPRAIRFQWAPFCLALLAAATVAVNGFVFKLVAKLAAERSGHATTAAFWPSLCWQYMGFAAMAAILLLVARGWRRQLVAMLRANPRSARGLNVLAEAVNLTGEVAMHYATLLVPLALAWTADGLQPAMTLGYGVVLTAWRPRRVAPMVRRALAQRVALVLVVALGAALLQPLPAAQ